MNYRHAFHAGNFADVFKHAVLMLILAHLRRKETPFAVLDLHAGIGGYDLLGEAPQRTGEYRAGIERLLAAPEVPALAEYLAAVRAENEGGALRHYPGSPRLARRMLRPQDRLALVELHPGDAATLKRQFAGDRQVRVHHMDAYQALRSLLPPPERRGLVLVDPPFEVRDEFARVLGGLRQGLKRWANGCYAVWYPIKARRPVEAFLGEVAMLGARPVLVAELMLRPDDDPERLNGCGMVILRPPWKLDETLRDVLPQLAQVLAGPEGRAAVRWLVEE